VAREHAAGLSVLVKLPRTITHDLALEDAREPFVAFLHQTEGLAEKRGPVLVQLPPSLAFDEAVVRRFFELVRGLYNGIVVCEPRHATWFSPAVDSLLEMYAVARVAADPAPVAAAADPAGWPGVVYFRLHGSPRKYWSRYDEEFLATRATAIRRLCQPMRCGASSTTPQAELRQRMRCSCLNGWQSLARCPVRIGKGWWKPVTAEPVRG
jgi:uncharacterized protein YecE (DUF72 family)